jgi:Putative Ig domain
MRVAQPLASKSFASELPVWGIAPRGITRPGLVPALLVAVCLAMSPRYACASDYVYIGGSPATTVTAGAQYSFQPSVSTPAASRPKVAFSIRNKPFWATFNATTGLLTGNVNSNQLGQYPNVTITASDGVSSAQLPPFSIAVVSATRSTPTAKTATSNLQPPSIVGSPLMVAKVGSPYSFQPRATDPNGRAVTFAIKGAPSWTTFNTSTGLLSGTPTSANADTTSSIVITASDGLMAAALAFSITVDQAASGSVTLYWTPATENTDGSTLTNLAGYIINYGTSASSLTNMLKIPTTGVADYVVSNLAPATYYFDIRAYTTNGTEGPPSGLVSTTVD